MTRRYTQPKDLSIEDKKDIYHLRQAGETVKDICGTYNLSRGGYGTVIMELERHHIHTEVPANNEELTEPADFTFDLDMEYETYRELNAQFCLVENIAEVVRRKSIVFYEEHGLWWSSVECRDQMIAADTEGHRNDLAHGSYTQACITGRNIAMERAAQPPQLRANARGEVNMRVEEVNGKACLYYPHISTPMEIVDYTPIPGRLVRADITKNEGDRSFRVMFRVAPSDALYARNSEKQTRIRELEGQVSKLQMEIEELRGEREPES